MNKEYAAQEALQPGVMKAPEGESAASEVEEVAAPMKEKLEGKLSDSDQAYLSGLMKMLHGKETAPAIDDMLKSGGKPEEVIPAVALQVNQQMEKAVGKKPPLETALLAGIYLVQDLIEIGNTGGFFNVQDEEEVKLIMQRTMQPYIEQGLKDHTIDPIELQSLVEPLMSEEHADTGMRAATATGIPTKPTAQTAMSAYGRAMEQRGFMKASPKEGGA